MNTAKMEAVADIVCAYGRKSSSPKISLWMIASWLISRLKILSNNSEGLTKAFRDIALCLQARQGCTQCEMLFLHFTETLSFLENAIKKSSHQSLRIVGETADRLRNISLHV